MNRADVFNKIRRNRYALADTIVAVVVVLIAGGFAFILPDHLSVLRRLGTGILFGIGFLFLYFLIRKTDDVIEAETMLFDAISGAGWISQNSNLTEITQMIATTATTIFKEGVKGYKNEIRYLYRSVNAISTMIREGALDKVELRDTVKMLHQLDDKVNQAKMQRVARAKADLDLIQDMYKTNDAASEAIATLQSILDSSQDKEEGE